MRIALSTGGGDAPGLNAVIRAATLAAVRRGWEVVGIRDGFNGLMFPEHYRSTAVSSRSTPSRSAASVTAAAPSSAAPTAAIPCHYPVAASRRFGDLRGPHRPARRRCSARPGSTPWSSIGGDGSLTIAQRLHEAGLRIDRRPQDDRQRPRPHERHVRFRHRRVDRDRADRPGVHHGHVAQPRVRGRGDGSVRGLDRAQRRAWPPVRTRS